MSTSSHFDKIAALELEADADVATLIAGVARVHSRPLTIHRMSIDRPPDRHGVWIATDSSDHLVITSTAGPLTVIHDLAHVLCDHIGTTTPTPVLVEYTPDQESEADHVAALLVSAYPDIIAGYK